jgi:hypothetical protein
MGECDYPQEQRPFQDRLLQFRVLGFGLLEDGDVGVGVYVAMLRIDRSMSEVA